MLTPLPQNWHNPNGRPWLEAPYSVLKNGLKGLARAATSHAFGDSLVVPVRGRVFLILVVRLPPLLLSVSDYKVLLAPAPKPLFG